MTARRLRNRHLDALRDVVDAAARVAPDLAIPWAVLGNLRSLLRSDLVVFEGRDHDRGRSYFSQVSSRDLQVFTVTVDPDDARRFWTLVRQPRSRCWPLGLEIAGVDATTN